MSIKFLCKVENKALNVNCRVLCESEDDAIQFVAAFCAMSDLYQVQMSVSVTDPTGLKFYNTKNGKNLVPCDGPVVINPIAKISEVVSEVRLESKNSEDFDIFLALLDLVDPEAEDQAKEAELICNRVMLVTDGLAQARTKLRKMRQEREQKYRAERMEEDTAKMAEIFKDLYQKFGPKG
jgi:hypothetical protein